MEHPVLDEIVQRGTLIVLTRNAPTTYFEKQDQQMGFEYDLAVSFANHLNVVPRFHVYSTTRDLLDALRQGKGDLVAAGITITQDRMRQFRFGPVYMEVEQQVVCRRGGKRPRSIDRLGRVRLAVIKDSNYESLLRDVSRIIPGIHWQTVKDISTEQALSMVWEREVDCTIADSNIMAINRRYYPELVVQFPISESQPIAWVMSKRAIFLEREVQRWFRQLKRKGDFDRIYERYFGLFEWSDKLDFMENRIFLERVQERLPLFQSYFQEAERRYNIPWKLLAALSYQESGWDVNATSPTGVKGIMMLTANTAKGLGVTNRLDARESILGGAWYLAQLMRKLPANIPESERVWFALATYNVGFGHLLDALELAERLGENSTEWRSMRRVLPLLSNKSYYETLKFGYARGSEPVEFVQNTRHFLDVLEKMDDFMPARILKLNALNEEERDEGNDGDEASLPNSLTDIADTNDDDDGDDLNMESYVPSGTLTLRKVIKGLWGGDGADVGEARADLTRHIMDFMEPDREQRLGKAARAAETAQAKTSSVVTPLAATASGRFVPKPSPPLLRTYAAKVPSVSTPTGGLAAASPTGGLTVVSSMGGQIAESPTGGLTAASSIGGSFAASPSGGLTVVSSIGGQIAVSPTGGLAVSSRTGGLTVVSSAVRVK